MAEPARAEPADVEAAGRWRTVRRRWAAAYVVTLVVVIAAAGIPTDRGSLFLIVIGALGITCIGQGWQAFGRVLLDWLPFTAVLIVYDYSRGLARLVHAPLHVGDVAAVDRWVFGTIPTVALQDRFLHPQAHWYDAVATLTYTSHFLATPIVAAVLWRRNRQVWLAFVRRVVALAVAGLMTYAAFPAAPPWYAGSPAVHAIAPVTRATSHGWSFLHIDKAGNLLQEGQAASNPVAAMPSLHTAYATMITIFVLTYARRRWRWVIVAYPPLMGLSLVYLGEHYVVDVVAGVVYALVVEVLLRRYEHRRAQPVSKAPLPMPEPGAVTLGR